MSQNNLLQGYNWDSQYEDGQFCRPLQDEVISVYEVYVKEEESLGLDNRSDGSVVSGSSASTSGDLTSAPSEHQLLQQTTLKDGSMDLDVAIDSEIINVDGSVTKLLGKESMKYKIVDQIVNADDESTPVHFDNQTVSEQQIGNPSSTGPRLIDKDDPRSRLHFVKYLKRDGKTLKIWECGICTKEFRHQYTLMRHLPTHTDERNFKCDACGKAFRQLSTLSQHKAIHSDARPYICEFCKKTFNRVSTLISHRKTHSEHKPHKCHVCGKGFHQKGNLRNHVFTHTNERPYKCEMCGKGFNQMSNLVCHKIKAHAHSEKMQYSCGLCGKEFPRRFALRSHEEYKHGIKYRNPGGIQREQKLAASKNSTSASTSTCTSAAASKTLSTCSVTPSTIVTTTSTPSNLMRNNNVRIVKLPNCEFNEGSEVGEKLTEYMDSIVIDRIDTRALENAIVQGQTPFALLKPVEGIPVLVKVSSVGLCKHLLTPATADDLRMVEKMSLSPTLIANSEGLKPSQIKVPVVATITQSFDENGEQTFTIDAPGSDQELESLVAPLDSHFQFQDIDSSLRLHSANALNMCDRPDSSEFDANAMTAITMTMTTATATPTATTTTTTTAATPPTATTTTSTTTKTTTTTVEANYQSDNCNELLELAAQGGIQFVRATEDGRYEVMSNSEARELMAQNSHDVTILDGDDADALNILNSQEKSSSSCIQEDLAIDDSDSQIMILDSLANVEKSIALEGIEIFEDNKDIRILDPKNLDERMLDGMTFLSQMKIDDLILVPSKSSSNVTGCTIGHEYSGILGQRNELAGLVNKGNNQQSAMSSFLAKSQAQQSIISDTMNYLRLSEELTMFNDEEEEEEGEEEDEEEEEEEEVEDHHRNHHQQQQYGEKIKFSDFEATIGGETSSLFESMGHQQRIHCVNSSKISDYYCVNETRNYWDSQRNIPSFGEVKILGARGNNLDSLENPSLPLQDIRIIGNYDQYLGSSSLGLQQQLTKINNHGRADEAVPIARKEVKILGKKLECGFFESDEDGKLVKIEQETDARKRMILSTIIPRDSRRPSSPNYPEVAAEHRSLPSSKGAIDFLLQTCSPDFLKFDNSQRCIESPDRPEYETKERAEDFEELAEFD